MGKPVAILFFLVYLAAVVELEQLARIPVLIQHYREHIRMEGRISFLEFLREHYIQDDPSDADYLRDMQLPFKTSQHFFVLMTAAGPRPIVEYNNPPADMHQHYKSPFNDPAPSNPFNDCVFQPPRIAAA